MSSGFSALRYEDDESSSSGSGGGNNKEGASSVALSPPAEGASVTVPAYEDLSNARSDEVTVLEAVYGDDFSNKVGVWNCPLWTVHVRPPDLEPEKIGSHLHLQLQLGKKYPYVVPKIEIQNVVSLSPTEQQELRRELHERAVGLAKSGNFMMIELVQVAEDFLLAHNRAPNMSAWEQMQEREKKQKRYENEAKEALAKLMDKEASVTFDETSGRRSTENDVMSKDFERELLRAREAIEVAEKLRGSTGDGLLRRSSSGTVDVSPSEDDFEIDLDYNPAAVSASRYETDFVEMGTLGRGGGGEVVKARNRLDGRIYAVKKILLEREDGAMAKFGALQNQKLRREVTTISRMTHKNIVRYYQAWVEGDGAEDDATGMIDSNNDFEPTTAPVRVIEEESGESGEESDVSQGWWASSDSPDSKRFTPKRDSAGEWESEKGGAARQFASQESDSGLDIFDNDLGAQSPLMNGLGFQTSMYRGIIKGDDSSRSESFDEESDWDEDSSIKIGTGVKGRKILYIQMEFCSTTLRKLIDERQLEKMEKNEIWRLVRQIIEALAYIHGRKLIHRDLKPGT